MAEATEVHIRWLYVMDRKKCGYNRSHLCINSELCDLNACAGQLCCYKVLCIIPRVIEQLPKPGPITLYRQRSLPHMPPDLGHVYD